MTVTLLPWQEFAALCDVLDLTPVHTDSTGMCRADVDGEAVWADLAGVTLDFTVPGAMRLQQARLAAWGQELDAAAAARWEVATPEERAVIRKQEQAAANMPDPPDYLMDREHDRQGRGEYR